MTNIYFTEFMNVAKRAYSMWNRDPSSPSFGSFDRLYWGWKYKDFCDATLQYAVKLAIKFAENENRTTNLPLWIEGFVKYCKKIQCADGSFNQAYPYEKTPGVIYDILSALIFVRQGSYLSSRQVQKTLDNIIEKGVSFALRTDEKHGEIANHLAQYAYELLHYASYSGNERAKKKGKLYLERLHSLWNDEGWFMEYSGPDPGYQTRALRYLVKCAELEGGEELWDKIYKAADFVETCLMPDGSVHPMLGARSTALVYPSAFEVLALSNGAHLKLAGAIRSAWEKGCVPLPSWIDFHNAIRLADDAHDAAQAYASNTAASQPLEQDKSEGKIASSHIELKDAGIGIWRERDLVVYVASRLGGVVIVYAKDAQGDWKLVYEDCGYLLFQKDNDGLALTRMPASGELVEFSEGTWKVRSHFYVSLHDELTPYKLVLLRVFNLTFLRFQWVGDLFRKYVAHRLMSQRQKLPVTLTREVSVTRTGVHVKDRISDVRRNISSPQRGKLFRCRRLTGIHMASSRYLQMQELQCILLPWMLEVPWGETGEVSHDISVSTRNYD